MKKKILVVDDERGVLEAVNEILLMEGYEVQAVSEAQHIHTHLSEFNPDLVMLDVFLSGNDGREICRQLKEDRDHRSVPVILMSAQLQAEESVYDCGANAFIAKPFDIDSMLQLVETNLSEKTHTIH